MFSRISYSAEKMMANTEAAHVRDNNEPVEVDLTITGAKMHR